MPLQFASNATLQATVGELGSWASLVSFTVAGLSVEQSNKSTLYRVAKYLGDENVPKDIKRLRRSAYQLLRRMGQPVIIKHMFSDRDAKLGIAQSSPAAPDAYGNQTRGRDPYSYGTGFCSVQLSKNEWISPGGPLVTANTSPGPGFVQAPYYRGYGPGYLAYIIEPDVALDVFKLAPSGAIVKTQDQTVLSPWFPEISDNDLIINVEMDADGNITDAHERYQAKMSKPISIRGLDRRGRREYNADHGNRWIINQAFTMNTVPLESPLMSVETDR